MRLLADLVARPISRRGLLRGLGLGLVAVPLAKALSACDDGTTATTTDTSTTSATTADTASADTTTADTSDVAWLTGGTAGMSGVYENPFTNSESCALRCAMTLGPCYAETVERQDISEGYPGLPVRLAFQVVDEACEPIVGATVDIWHTRNSGLYSGSDANDFCTSGDADATSHRYFRGKQTSDTDGRVDFDTCFPGWYASRTVHIHFRVQRAGQDYVVSQLFFPQALIQAIFAGHSDYAAFGQPDTSNASDSVLGSTAPDPYLFAWAKQSDGAMLAWKRLVIRDSLSDSVCSVGGGGGPPR